MTRVEAPVGAKTRLAADLERRCVEGLCSAASALAGGDPTPACRAFSAWRRGERRRSWPWLPGLCWSALEPLGAAFPADDEDAVTLGRFLIGAELDPAPVRRALAAVEQRAGARRAGSRDLTVDLRRRTLEAAVDRFWDELRSLAERLCGPVSARDRAGADRIVAEGRRQLEGTAERVESHARRLAEALAAVTPPPATPASSTVRDEQGPQATAPLARSRPAASAQTARRAGPVAPAAAGVRMPVVRPSSPAPVEREDDEYRRIREHPLVPVVFLAAVTLVALIWLLMISAGGGQ